MQTSHYAALDYSHPGVKNLLIEKENLAQANLKFAEEIRFLRHEIMNLTAVKEDLTESLRLALRKRFAPSSEMTHHPNQGTLFNEAELEASFFKEEEEIEADQADVSSPARKNKRRGRPVRKPLPKSLPREIRVIDLSDGEKICSLSGLPLVAMGKEVSEQLDIQPAKFVVIETHRLKYVCHCSQCKLEGDGPNDTEKAKPVKTAELPGSPIAKSMATPGLLASIAVSKYEYALPLHRQEGYFKGLGVELRRSTMGTWMVRCGGLITPLINLMWDELLKRPLVYADETPLSVHKGTGKKSTAKSYMWAFMGGGGAGPPVALYELGPSRSHVVALRYLGDYSGYLHTDGYEAYETLAVKCPGITLVGDWVHVRRRFDEAIKAQPDPKSDLIKAKKAFDLINELFAIEREIEDSTDNERLKVRQDRSQKIVDALKLWAEETQISVPPKSLTGKAISYMLGQWHKLLYFLRDGRVGLDTNPIENKIRPFVIGRKNWLFCDTVGGAEASAALYSLIVTAKANGLNTFEYLKAVFTELPKAKCVEDIEALLPWQWKSTGFQNTTV